MSEQAPTTEDFLSLEIEDNNTTNSVVKTEESFYAAGVGSYATGEEPVSLYSQISSELSLIQLLKTKQFVKLNIHCDFF